MPVQTKNLSKDERHFLKRTGEPLFLKRKILWYFPSKSLRQWEHLFFLTYKSPIVSQILRTNLDSFQYASKRRQVQQIVLRNNCFPEVYSTLLLPKVYLLQNEGKSCHFNRLSCSENLFVGCCKCLNPLFPLRIHF